MTQSPRGPQPPMPQVKLDLSQTTPLQCDNCGNPVFEDVTLLRKVSALVSPTGQDSLVPIPTFACNACGYVNAELLPPPLRMKAADAPQASSTPTNETYTGPRLVTE